MNGVPLLAHARLDEVFAYQPEGPSPVRDLLAAASALAGQLPPGRHFVNLCQDRYRFTIALAAGLISGRTSLQPASQAPETLRQLLSEQADAFCLCDGAFDSGDLPRIDFPDLRTVDSTAVTGIPVVASDFPAIIVYTSGTTGRPLPYGKSWGSLVRNARAEASRLGLLAGTRYSLVGTVPAQHMYGFESTVLLAMHGDSPFWSGKPFYPQDIAAALAAVPRPRLLVTTPFHLATLLASGVELPPVDRLLSATAPLARELAAEAETRLAAPLHEIYGCTESGQLASRRLLAGDEWLPLDGVCLQREGGQTIASGGHIEGRVALADEIELLADGRFRLHGRGADLISVAGKRSSLAYLDHQLRETPGVVDGAFFFPDEAAASGVTRLCAFVVADHLSERQLLTRLRQRIDPVFLPRPLVLLDALPRNDTGKLPRTALQALYERHVFSRQHAAH